MLVVFIQEKSGATREVHFDKSMLMVGRAAGNDLVLDQGGVSRFHATIIADEGQLFAQDVGSTNGTFIGERRIDGKTVIPLGEGVVVGDYLLRFRVEEETIAVSDTAAPIPIPEIPHVPSMAPLGVPSQGVTSSPSESSQPPVITSERVPPQEGMDRDALKNNAGSEDSRPRAEDRANSAREFYWQSLSSFLQPIWQYITDESVSEIVINGPSEIYIERKGQMVKVPERFSTDQLNAAVLNIAQYVGRRVSEDEPYMDARLPDGSRVAVLLPPCSRKGTSVSIRKFSKEKLTLDRLISFGSLSAEMVMYLKAAVLLKKNIIVSGGTSSGKTSLLNVVSGLIPDEERILTIEDSAELQLRQEHVLPMETKPADKKGRGEVTIRDLVRASLRMRPDRVVVGEIRSGEALDLLQAMNTGHSGSMATVHASSPTQALTRLETLALFSGVEIPMRALREQVSTAIEVIIQAARLPDHSRKITHISEVAALKEDGSYQTTDIFRFKRDEMKDGKIFGRHIWTGARPRFYEEMELMGLTDVVQFFGAAEKS